MNKLKPHEVFTTKAEEGSGVYYDLQRMEDREQIEKQSLYCFTREELESLLKDTWLAALEYEFDDSPHPSTKTFLNNLFNDK